MQITRGTSIKNPKVMIYGLSGAGKSTLASQFSRPIFLDIEGSTDYLDVARVNGFKTYTQFLNTLRELVKTPADKREFDTIVIDSIDWLVRLVKEKVAGIDKDNLSNTVGKANGGYGNGKLEVENHIRTQLIPALDASRAMGYTIVLVAHAESKEIMNADGFNEPRITPKIDETTMHSFVEWCDHVLYMNAESRKLLLEPTSTILAKNRVGLVGEVDPKEVDINELLKIKKEK